MRNQPTDFTNHPDLRFDGYFVRNELTNGYIIEIDHIERGYICLNDGVQVPESKVPLNVGDVVLVSILPAAAYRILAGKAADTFIKEYTTLHEAHLKTSGHLLAHEERVIEAIRRVEYGMNKLDK